MSDSFTTEAFSLLGIGLVFIGIRTYARISTVGIAGFKADDYLMLLAAVVYSAETALAYSVGAYWKGLANNGMTDAERKALDPSSAEYHTRVNGSKTQIAGWSTYTFLLWVLKASMCTFYLRLTDGLDYFKRIYFGFIIIFCTWVTVFLSILLGCRPMSKNWQIYPDPGNSCQPAISRIDIFVTVVLNVTTDIYLMSIPLPMLWKANLPAIKKLGLSVLFSGGIFVTMAGILRCVLIITNPITGAQQAGSWACRETFVAVVTSNLPMIFPMVRRWGILGMDSIRSSNNRSSKNQQSNSGGSSGPAFFLEDKNPRRGMGPRSVNPITNITFSESEERIYNQQQQQQPQSSSQQSQQFDDQPLQPLSPSHTQAGIQPLGQHPPLKFPSLDLDLEDGRGRGHSRSASQGGPYGNKSMGYITKEVELHITEEERRRQSAVDSDTSESEAVEGANKGNYYLTHNQDGRPRASTERLDRNEITSGSPSNSISPLASTSWFHTSSGSGSSQTRSRSNSRTKSNKHSSFGLKSGRRH